MSLDVWFQRAFGDDDAEAIGSGWWSGVLGVFLGFLGFGAVLCLHFPEWLTSPELREVYPMPIMRRIIQVTIGAAFAFSAISGMLRRRKTMAVAGMSLSVLAVLLGGSTVEIDGSMHTDVYVGFDWFLLKLMMLALVFVPLERLFPHKREQSTFREGWTTDAVHLMVSHVGIQVLSMLTILPATVAFEWAVHPAVQSAVSSLPFVVQVLMIVLIVDLIEYWVHRTFHHTKWLWPFHAVHHSADSMDWLAGSRIHVVDTLATRTLSFIPIFVLGVDPDALVAYVVFVSGHAVFIHANLRWNLRWLEPFLVTPRFHHWHHGADEEAHDKNFAVHFPWIDRIFGTYYLPGDRWPDRVGIDGESPKGGYFAHLVYPFVRPSSSQTTSLLAIGAALIGLGAGCQESPGACEVLAEAPVSLRGLRAELAGSVELPFAPARPALGDFDDDGNAEIAVADASGGGLIVFRGTPQNGYQLWQEEEGPHENRRVAVADLDRDGIDDLVAARVGFQGPSSVVSSLKVVWGDADFDIDTGAQPDTEEVPGTPRAAMVALATGDFDNDGLRDAAYLDAGGSGYLFLGAGQRSFELGRRANNGGREMAQATSVPGGQSTGDALVTFGDNWGTTACNPDPETSTFGGVFLKRAEYDGETLSRDGRQSPWVNSDSRKSRGQTGLALLDVLEGSELEAIGAFDTGLHVFRADSGGFASEPAVQACLGSDDSPRYVSGLTLADLDGNGTPEFVTLEASTKRLAVFGLGGDLVTKPVLIDAALPGGDELVGHDLDGDGIDELVVSDLVNGQLHIVRMLEG